MINGNENEAENKKNRSQRYDINTPKYTKYEICLSIMMVLGIKQHLSNI